MDNTKRLDEILKRTNELCEDWGIEKPFTDILDLVCDAYRAGLDDYYERLISKDKGDK